MTKTSKTEIKQCKLNDAKCNAKKRKKCVDCCNCSTNPFPTCIFFSMITAIVIALILAITFASLADRYEIIDATRFKGRFEQSIQDNVRDENGIVVIDGAAIIDWVYNTKASGFIYVSSLSCGTFCDAYEEYLAIRAAKHEKMNLYHFNATSANDKNYASAIATKITLGSDNAPMLLYVKDGVIYDRVDNIEPATMESFINKYK